MVTVYQVKLTQDFTRFQFITPSTPALRRIWSELRFVQVLSDAAGGKYEPYLEAALRILREAKEKDGVIVNAAAEAAEKEILPLAKEAKSYRYMCAGHAHIDMNWRWGYDETVNICLDTFRTMLQLMKEYPDFKFSQSQAAVYRMVEQYAPEMLEEIKARVAQGRWELTTAAWCETDKNMPSGENLSRQILYAKDYMSRLFSVDPDSIDVDFNPDTFGHSVNVPEICARGGIKYYYHCRCQTQHTVLCRWRAPSGAEVIQYSEPFWYHGQIDHTLAEYAVNMEAMTGSRTIFKPYGVGDHGGGPTRKDLDTLIEMNSWPVYPQFVCATFREYFQTVESRRDTLPVQEGEYNFLFDGCYSSQSRIKAGSRRSERILQDAELFDSLAVLRSGLAPHPEIFRDAWKRVNFNTFHDILTGSGMTETREYAMGEYQKAAAAACARQKAAVFQLTEQMDTASILEPVDTSFTFAEGGGVGYGGFASGCCRAGGKTRVFHLFNPLPWERTSAVELTVWDYEGDEDRLAVRMPGGDWKETEILEKDLYWHHHFTKILAVVTVPASGWTSVIVGERPVQPSVWFNTEDALQHPETYVIENSKVRAEFNPETASLCSLYHKETKRELIPQGKEGRFELAIEAIQKTLHYKMSAWITGRQKEIIPLTDGEILSPAGSLRSRLQMTFHFKSSTLQVLVYLDPDSSVLHYRLNCDWREFGSQEYGVPRLQFTLPTVCAGDEFLYDVPFSFMRRKAEEMDKPANRFVVAEDDKDAVLVSAHDNYGYRTANGHIQIPLIRGSFFTDLTPETGVHELQFSVVPTAAGKTNQEYARLAQECDHPIYAISGRVHPGRLPVAASYVQLVSGNVMISSVKISEDKQAVIIKLYETERKEQRFTIDCGFRPASAFLADQLERATEHPAELDGSLVSAAVKPNQLVILRLAF